MTLALTAVSFEAEDPSRLASFWAGLLGREVVPRGDRRLLVGDDTEVALQIVPGEPHQRDASERNVLHLHLTADAVPQERTVAEALRLGAHHLDVGQAPDEGHVVLADPEGNEFCVIEAGNTYLAGCGFLGEVACDGGREVGLFWSRVLGWPLVWDQDEETAIQSPRGGTKVAWGGPPDVRRSRPRQWFEVEPDGAVPLDELVSWGAQLIRHHDDGSVELADPGGNLFLLRSQPSSTGRSTS